MASLQSQNYQVCNMCIKSTTCKTYLTLTSSQNIKLDTKFMFREPKALLGISDLKLLSRNFFKFKQTKSETIHCVATYSKQGPTESWITPSMKGDYPRSVRVVWLLWHVHSEYATLGFHIFELLEILLPRNWRVVFATTTAKWRKPVK